MVFELLLEALMWLMKLLLLPFYVVPDVTNFYAGKTLEPFRDFFALIPWKMLVPVLSVYLYARAISIGAGIVRVIKSWIPAMGR